jgi:hypothetical protein
MTGSLLGPPHAAGFAVDQVEDQQCAQPIVREPFPQLGDEQD